jgi:hypothetical protein
MGTLFEVNGTLGSIVKQLETVENIITPSQLTGDTDNYNPTGLATCNVIRQDISSSIELSGLTAPASGVNKVIWFCSITTGNYDIKFMHNSGSSSAGNKFFLRDNANKDLKQGETVGLWYDHLGDSGNGCWRPLTRLG